MQGEDDQNDDVDLLKASTSLLSEIQDALPNLLWKSGTRNALGEDSRVVHSQVRRRDLEFVVKRVGEFQVCFLLFEYSRFARDDRLKPSKATRNSLIPN